MVFFDTHIHLHAPQWQSTPVQRIAAARTDGIGYLLQPGVRVNDWDALLSLAQEYPEVYLAPGLHPAYAEQWTPDAKQLLRKLARHPKVLAIGEIGLDGTSATPLTLQQQVFCDQLEIALETGLPVLLHGRQATGKVLEILRDFDIGRRVGGIWHGFSGSVEVAHELIHLGFLIGVGPILLRNNARRLPQVVKTIPATALVLETDAPDMATQPGVLLKVAQRMAQLRGWTMAETARITTENALKLFKFTTT